MKVTHPIIADRISEHVKGILVIENYQNKKPFMLPLFANGTPTLVFQTAKGQIKNQSNYLTLFGQTVLPGQLFINGEFTLIAYFLTPLSLPILFGIPANELTDNPIDLNSLSNNSVLQEQLLNAKTISKALYLLDDYIITLITKSKAGVNKIKYATEKILLNPYGNILVQVQNELCVTERTFQRLFEKNVGVSPNQFRRINQFNKAFQQLNRRQFQSLSDIAFDNGYADQSHYIKTFKEFTLITPTDYLRIANLS
ncbi:MAG: helix-turn-helix domain-containing protein [Chitinophagaceae bacterium]